MKIIFPNLLIAGYDSQLHSVRHLLRVIKGHLPRLFRQNKQSLYNDMEFRKHRNEVNPNDKEVNSYSSAKTYPIPILV